MTRLELRRRAREAMVVRRAFRLRATLRAYDRSSGLDADAQLNARAALISDARLLVQAIAESK